MFKGFSRFGFTGEVDSFFGVGLKVVEPCGWDRGVEHQFVIAGNYGALEVGLVATVDLFVVIALVFLKQGQEAFEFHARRNLSARKLSKKLQVFYGSDISFTISATGSKGSD